MANDKLRRCIAWDAARLMYDHQETEYDQAKRKAVQWNCRGSVEPDDLPSNSEIRDEIEAIARLREGERRAKGRADRFQVYESLLLPLENVKQSPKYHPEGDALYHSLQVFHLAQRELAYDEEFLLAALLHDVGKAIDAKDPVQAGLEALDGFITPRTEWLIRYHMDAHRIDEGTLGARAIRRLKQSEDFENLLLLSQCDRGGRIPGAEAPELEEAIQDLRDLARMCGDW